MQLRGQDIENYSIPALKGSIRGRSAASIALFIVGFILTIFFSIALYSSTREPEYIETYLVVMFSIYLLASIVLLCVSFGLRIQVFRLKKAIIPMEEAERKRLEEEKQKAEAERQKFINSLEKRTWNIPMKEFSKLCKERNVSDLSAESSYQRAKLIVKEILERKNIPGQYHSYYTSRDYIHICFNKLRGIQNMEAEKQLQAQIAKESKNEKAYEKKCLQYAKYSGRSKMLQYNKKEINYYQNEIKKYTDILNGVSGSASRTYDAFKQQELNWGTAAGIAHAVGGPAAGLSIALESEIENAAIRQQNSELFGNLTMLEINARVNVQKDLDACEKSLAYYLQEREKIKTLLVEEVNEQELLTLLKPQVKSAEKTITGAVKVTIGWKKTEGLTIFGDVPALIDGSVNVVLKADGEVIGSAIVVLPEDGSRYAGTAPGICCNPTKNVEHFTTSIEPNHLWAIEIPS